MAQLEPWKKTVDSIGGALVYVAAEKKEGVFQPVKFLEKHPVSFPFLLDEDRAVTKAYGVYHRLGVDAINIARPATFVVGRDQRVRYVYVGASQNDRAPVDEILNVLKRAASE
jgi:peroxiredoxin